MMLPGTNLEHARSFNRRVVLETVRLFGPLSRAEIARQTQLSPQAVSNIARELEDAGLLRSPGRRKSSRGQPPVDLAINAEGAHTIGFSIDQTSLAGVLANLAGEPLAVIDMPIEDTSPGALIPRLAETAKTLMRSARLKGDRLWGVGVAMPGPFDVEGLTSVGPTTLPGWRSVSLPHDLGRRLELPVFVENDATAAAIGERLYGVAKALRSFAYVYFGAGLGLGLILDGRPYKGAFGNAGEFGHLPVMPGGPRCWCGNDGCLERAASLYAAAEAAARPGEDESRLTPDEIGRRYAEGDPALRRWLKTSAEALRRALAIIENLLDPETIVLGGRLPEPILADLLGALAPLPFTVSARAERPMPRLVQATAGEQSPALGAAALPLFEGLAPQLDLVLKGRSPPAPF